MTACDAAIDGDGVAVDEGLVVQDRDRGGAQNYALPILWTTDLQEALLIAYRLPGPMGPSVSCLHQAELPKRGGQPAVSPPNGDMGPRGACPKDVDVAVEKGGAGGETKAPGAYVDKGLETMAVWGRLRIEVTPGSATSWDRPVERSYLVRVRRDEFSVVVGWGLSRRSAESLAERLIELLGPGSPVPGRPAA